MNRLLTMCFAAILAFGSVVSAGEEFSEVEYYKKLAEKQLAELQQQPEAKPQAATPSPVQQTTYYYCEDEAAPPANAFVVIPQYFNSRAKKDTAKFRGGDLILGDSRANGAGVTTVYNRRVNDWFSFSVMYQYGFMSIRGGSAFPVDGTGRYAKERTRYHSHVVGFQPEFNFGAFGRLIPSIIQGFDRASGNMRVYDRNGNQLGDSITQNDEGTNVTSLMAWYEKDFNFCNNWKITPYAGWRSLYVKMKSAGDTDGDHLWVHLVSGGMKVAYQGENIGFNLRAGVSHRTTSDDVPGYGNRAVANGVVHFSHRANLDKTVGSVGAGINYTINNRALVGVNYDGFFGSKTSAHMGTLNFIFPF